MFDNDYFILGGGKQSHYHSHSHNVTVEENRAPTDESVKLLREMEEKVFKSVIDRIRVVDNTFNCEVVKRRDEFWVENQYVVAWSLNGQRFITKYTPDIGVTSLPDIIQGLVDALGKDIGRQLLIHAFERMDKSFWGY